MELDKIKEIFEKDGTVPVTVNLPDSWLHNEEGFVVKRGVDPDLPNELSGIIVDFPDIKHFHFNSRMDRSIPHEKKRWVGFTPEELNFGHKIKTESQIIEKLFEDLKVYASQSVMHEPRDGSCIVKGCAEKATTYGAYNYWGNGVAFKACQKHAKECGNKWCESSPFEAKEENLIIPQWLPKKENSGS